MAVVTFVTFNAPTKVWSRTTGGIISYPSTVTAAVGGPFIVNPIIVPFDPIHETGGSFWRLTEGPNIGFLVSAHSNSLGYGDITITYDGQPDTYAEGVAKINPLASWRLLIKDMGGETGGSSHMLTFNAETFVWSRTTTGIIKWPHEFEHEAGGPYAVNPIVVPFDPEHETGGSFWRLTEGPYTGFLVSFWSNELGYGDITVEDNPDFDRGPGAVLATLGPGDVVPLPPTGAGDQPAHLAGASLTYNTPGEMHFTLLVDSPFIDIPQPKRTHYAIEFWDTDAQEWYESFAGWVWDFDATDTEVVFYGIDYLGAFQYTVDERYDPELGIDVPAPNGSLYINNTIREIVISQIDYAISRPDSMVGFVVRGDIAPMPYVISKIYSTFKDTLNFVVGLLDSHRAGTGKQSRISVRKIDGVYTVIVEDDPGVTRDNLLIQYGGLAQGYRAIPFGLDWASRVNFIGRNKEGLKVMYRAESSAVDQGLYGRIAQAPVYMDTEDYNDMKRRALQAAIDASRIGRQISAGLKLGSFRPLEGYDICDILPVDINHGAVTTKDWGSDDFGVDPPDDPSQVMASYWTILGISWESYDDGHWMTGLTLYPRGKRPTSEVLCVPPQEHQFTGVQTYWAALYEITGVDGSTIDVATMSHYPSYGFPYETEELTPDPTAPAMALAAFIFDNEAQGAPSFTAMDDFIIDYDHKNSWVGGPTEGGSAPESIIGHELIESPSGNYKAAITGNLSGYGSNGWATMVATIKARTGLTPAIRQSVFEASFGAGMTISLPAPPLAGSLIAVVLTGRNAEGVYTDNKLDNVTEGWEGPPTVFTPPDVPGAGAFWVRYARMMFWASCAVGTGLDIPSEPLLLEAPQDLVIGNGPPEEGPSG